jgi:hypothetical protein
MKKTIDRIAREILRLETLETRSWDRLDFHDLAVWKIKDALEAAYIAGARSEDHQHLTAIAALTEAGNNLIAAIDRANEEYDTGALDIIEPHRISLLGVRPRNIFRD